MGGTRRVAFVLTMVGISSSFDVAVAQDHVSPPVLIPDANPPPTQSSYAVVTFNKKTSKLISFQLAYLGHNPDHTCSLKQNAPIMLMPAPMFSTLSVTKGIGDYTDGSCPLPDSIKVPVDSYTYTWTSTTASKPVDPFAFVSSDMGATSFQAELDSRPHTFVPRARSITIASRPAIASGGSGSPLTSALNDVRAVVASNNAARGYDEFIVRSDKDAITVSASRFVDDGGHLNHYESPLDGLITLSVDKVQPDDVLHQITQQLKAQGHNLWVAWGIGGLGRASSVSLNLKNVTARQALSTLLPKGSWVVYCGPKADGCALSIRSVYVGPVMPR